jgi:hypothetical protein
MRKVAVVPPVALGFIVSGTARGWSLAIRHAEQGGHYGRGGSRQVPPVLVADVGPGGAPPWVPTGLRRPVPGLTDIHPASIAKPYRRS